MWIACLSSAGIVLLVAGLYWRHRVRRRRLYSQLAANREEVVTTHAPMFSLRGPAGDVAQAFRREFIARIEHVVDGQTLSRLREECFANRDRVERSFIPGHKKGGTLSYERVQRFAPNCLALFHSPELARWLEGVIGERVFPAADYDQSACSVLYYTQVGDHIGWHYDHNFYRGRHFTVLLSIVNQSAGGGPSSSLLQRQNPSGTETSFDTSENTLIVFEGARVRHRATSLGEGDLRVLLSMTFSTDPRTGPISEAARRIKDTAFFGPRALWD